MRLIIDNFAKIKHADIVIDGITVIAGENNTGKSTVGKILYSSFNSLCDIDLKIEQERLKSIRNIIRRVLRNTLMNDSDSLGTNFSSRIPINQISKDLTNQLIQVEEQVTKSLYESLFEGIVKKYHLDLQKEDIQEMVDDSYDKVFFLKDNKEYNIALELIGRYFLQVFGMQIQCLKEKELSAEISLYIKDKKLSLQFKNNKCIKWSRDYNILHEAFLIDDPFILDDLEGYYFPPLTTNEIRAQLVKRLRLSDNDLMDGIFDAVRAKETLEELYEVLSKVTTGKVSEQKGQWMLQSEYYVEPVRFENLSAGLKSFVLIKMLLEKGILKEKDVLVLDEPEIHLHPEWQILYAEMIVLLQKLFDLSIVVTTHSRDFLEAIELNAKKYGLASKCNFYLSLAEAGVVTFENVTNKLDKIYRQLVSPSMLLDKLRYEIEMEKNE